MLKANIMLECIELLEGRSHDDDEEQAPKDTASISPWLDRTSAGISFKGAL